MFDFNCNLTPNNKEAFDMLPYVSSANVCAGLFEGTPCYIKKIMEYAASNEIALGALISGNDKEWDDDEILANTIYQIGVVDSFARAYGLRIENVRLNGKIYDKMNEDKDFALKISLAIKQFNTWLNLIVSNAEIKSFIEKETGVRCAFEVDFTDKSSIRELREMETVPNTVHFETLENAKRAYDVIKPSPITYNRVAGEF